MKSLIVLGLGTALLAALPVAAETQTTSSTTVNNPTAENHDSRAAMREKMRKRMADKKAELDKNNDGNISQEEAANAPRLQENFAVIDSNKDGQLSDAEMKTWHQSQGGKRNPQAMREKMQARMKMADKNGDGQLSKDEAASIKKLSENFDAIDSNKDGQVSPAEMKAYGQTMRSQRSGMK